MHGKKVRKTTLEIDVFVLDALKKKLFGAIEA